MDLSPHNDICSIEEERIKEKNEIKWCKFYRLNTKWGRFLRSRIYYQTTFSSYLCACLVSCVCFLPSNKCLTLLSSNVVGYWWCKCKNLYIFPWKKFVVVVVVEIGSETALNRVAYTFCSCLSLNLELNVGLINTRRVSHKWMHN